MARRKLTAEREIVDRPPWVWGYRRCSHINSEESGQGLNVQHSLIETYTNALIVRRPELTPAAVHEDYSDIVVSAWKVPFRKRPAGMRLLLAAQAGDHIVVAEIGRAFRNLRDCLNTVEYLKDRQITIHFADLGVDTSTAVGEFTMQVLGAAKQLESGLKSEHGKAVIANGRRLGYYTGGKAPAGWRSKGRKGHKVLVPDVSQRAMLDMIVKLHDETSSTWLEIAEIVEAHLAAKQGRRPLRRSSGLRLWGHSRCQTAYTEAMEFRAAAKEGRPPVSPIYRNGNSDPS